MEEWLRDPQTLREVALRRVLRATITAAGNLAKAARGVAFRNDEQRWACLQLVRLAPRLIGPGHTKPKELPETLAHSSLSEERADELFQRMQGRARKQNGESWAQTFRTGGPCPAYATEQEAREYGYRIWDRNQSCQKDSARPLRLTGPTELDPRS